MIRRWTFILLLLCLPLRLWASVGLMANTAFMAGPVAAVAQAGDHPCHEAAPESTAPVALADHCDAGDCQSCAACHMPALHSLGLLDLSLKAPRDWVAHTVLRGYATRADSPFKPPVS
jgi:hypothetical protein